MRAIRRVPANERGIALPIALGMSMVVGIALVVVLQLASTGARHSERSRAQSDAYAVAEAGINVALSVLGEASDPTDPTLLPSTTVSVDGGEVTYSGTYALPVWTIISTGRVANPVDGGSAQITRTLNQKVTVQPLVPGATPPEWDRLFHARTDVCLEINSVTIPASVTSAGDLCLLGTGKITGDRSKVEVGDDVTLAGTPGPTQSPNMSPDAGAGWTNSSRIVSSNNSRASTTMLGNSQSANLTATDFDFAIPSGATITGIRVRVEGYASGTSVDDEDVYLLKGGSTAGITDHASSNDWPESSSSDEDDWTYGGNGDLWGTTWTAAQINNNSPTGFGVRIRVDNDSGGIRTANVDWIEVEVFYQEPETVNTSIGLSGAPISRAEIVGTCQKGTAGPLNSPCGAVDNVYAGTYTQTPPNLQKPQVDMQYWYDNAKPGPHHDCDVPGSFPGGFDNNGVMDGSLPDYGNDNEDLDQLTPTNSSYSCTVTENGTVVGELTWNHVTHVLTIKGQIFIDGNVRFDKDGTLINYNGRAILYAGGDLEFDEVVCAGGDGTNNCWGDMSDWDPEQNMMIILSRGWSEYDQGDNLEPAAFQGVMYAEDHCQIHQNFHSSGPIICDEIRIESTDGQWPDFYEWPELQSLIAGQMYGSFAVADDYAFILGEQTG
jgi:hypothetical protein